MTTLLTLSIQLRKNGYRMTRIREAIIQCLMEISCALSIQNIKEHLEIQGSKPNTSTLYRELQFLRDHGIAQEIVFKDGVMRYELKQSTHHHHLICNFCETIEPVEMEKHLEKTEQSIRRRKNFQITSHSLEFYGLCASCHE
ncbi:MAG: Fur family transcriptional regulator [bacterium]|nr:Fur family transcriptional regulator [bacterium]